LEYDSEFVSMKRSKLISRLRPNTLMLMEQYSRYYAVEPDQVVDSALSAFISKDEGFIEYLRGILKK